MAKLTLSVDDHVVGIAKEYAKRHGVSVSKIVENYLSALEQAGSRPSASTPVLRSVRGILKGIDVPDYRRHLEEKYR